MRIKDGTKKRQTLVYVSTYYLISIFSLHLNQAGYEKRHSIINQENYRKQHNNFTENNNPDLVDENISNYLTPEAISSLSKTFSQNEIKENKPQWQQAINYINEIFNAKEELPKQL